MLIYNKIAYWKQGEDPSVQVRYQCCGEICCSPSPEVVGLRLPRGAHAERSSFTAREHSGTGVIFEATLPGPPRAARSPAGISLQVPMPTHGYRRAPKHPEPAPVP